MSSNRLKLHVLGIDWQNDFCRPTGALFVPGADADAVRMAKFIRRIGPKVDMFHLTLDSHQVPHIAHACMWVGKNGQPPPPFTTITVDDVKTGVWRAVKPEHQPWFENYVQSLKTNGRYDLMVWPEHCRIGHEGSNIVPEIWDALADWSRTTLRSVNYVPKGSQPLTEHYSAMQADVQIPQDPTTKLNANLLRALGMADQLVITGEASSHCVANTVRDIAANFSDAEVRKFVILTDLMSPVPIAKKLADDFLDDMRHRGVTLTTSDKFLI